MSVNYSCTCWSFSAFAVDGRWKKPRGFALADRATNKILVRTVDVRHELLAVLRRFPAAIPDDVLHHVLNSILPRNDHVHLFPACLIQNWGWRQDSYEPILPSGRALARGTEVVLVQLFSADLTAPRHILLDVFPWHNGSCRSVFSGHRSLRQPGRPKAAERRTYWMVEA